MTTQTAKMRPGKTQWERGFAFPGLISAHRKGAEIAVGSPKTFEIRLKIQHRSTLPIVPDMR
jgi:hypothetical protein